MYFKIKTSTRKVKYHDLHWPGHETYIPAGVPYFQIHNGAIANGGHYKNFPLEHVQKILTKARTEYVEREQKSIPDPITTKYEMQEASKYSNTLTADDIPF